MTISKIQKLTEKGLVVIKDDYYGLIEVNEFFQIPKKEFTDEEREGNYSGINFSDRNGNRFPIEEVEVFALSKVLVSI